MVTGDGTLGQQLGLGDMWQPAPVRYYLASVQTLTDQGAQRLHVLMVDTLAGRVGFSFTHDELVELGRKIMEQTSGLTIPTNGRVTPG